MESGYAIRIRGWSRGVQRTQERRKEGQRSQGPWGTGPSSRVPLPHPRPFSGAREGKGRRVAGELAPTPGYTEEISLSLCLSACEPPPGPLPIPGLAPLLFPSQLHISHIPFPGPQAVPLRVGKGFALFSVLHCLPDPFLHLLLRLPQFLPSASLFLAAEPCLGVLVSFLLSLSLQLEGLECQRGALMPMVPLPSTPVLFSPVSLCRNPLLDCTTPTNS
jgi:hypothetical protein